MRNTYLEPSLSIGAVTGLSNTDDPAFDHGAAFRGKMKITQAFGGFSSCARSILPDGDNVGKFGSAMVQIESDFETMRSSVTRTYKTLDLNDVDHYVPPDQCKSIERASAKLSEA